MYDRRHVSIRSAARWVALMPLVMVGSMLFWTLALGLGGVSLLAVTGFTTSAEIQTEMQGIPADPAPTATEPVTGHMDPITVHIEESTEPEDVNDNAGAAAPAPDLADPVHYSHGL
jgi:hypothetical protein